MGRGQIPQTKAASSRLTAELLRQHAGEVPRQRAGRDAMSEGGESTHSMALTHLSSKRLEGCPIAQKVGERKHKYFDSSGKEVTYEQACLIADGVIFYQDSKDPTKGRLRQTGSFIGEDNARTILENSRAGSDAGSVANLADLDGHPALGKRMATVKEENDGEDDRKKRGLFGLMRYFIVLALLLAIAASSLPVARNQVAPFDSGHQATVGHIGGTYLKNEPLGLEIASLLKADEMGEDDISVALLDLPQVEEDDLSSRKKQEQQAAAEIDRILSARKESDILGPGELSQQQHEFHRIALLLHPDKGLVSAGDERAFVALRLVLAARRRALARRQTPFSMS